MGMNVFQRLRTRVSALAAVALGALLALGLAWSQPVDPPAAVGLLIVDEVGAIVGVGELGPEAAALELTVEVDGILRLVVVVPSGAPLLEREVFVGADGGLVVTSDAGFEDLEVFAARYTPVSLGVEWLESLVAERAAERWAASGLWLDRSLLPDVVPTDRIAAALDRGPFGDAIDAEVAALDEALDEAEEAPSGVAEEAREGGHEFGMNRREEALERAPDHAGEPGDAPDGDGPPTGAPPVEAPPVDAPPVDAPPAETPVGPPGGRPADPKDPMEDPPPFGPPIVIDPPVEPVPLDPLPDDAPPVDAPPVDAPPADGDTSDDEEGATSAP